ncbi:MAG: hypothetical protein HY902_01130 [Deltaproteobacteria bacterium]|nr:hypothetical protein [Deltaproteobacteria bacterium]
MNNCAGFGYLRSAAAVLGAVLALAGCEVAPSTTTAAPVDTHSAADAGGDTGAVPSDTAAVDTLAGDASQGDAADTADAAAPCVDLGCACTSDTACAAGADLCVLPVCTAGKCATKPKTCDDGNECTTDACDPKKGCTATPILNCGVKALYSTTFSCQSGDAKDWTMDPSPAGAAVWAIDGTPSNPGFYSADCSLNFNNGKDFACPGDKNPGKLRAFSPVIDATSMTKGAPLTLTFRYAGSWETGGYDSLVVSIGADATTTTQLADLDPPKAPWDVVKLDLANYAGSKFVLTFAFSSVDCIGNGDAGAFVDDLKVFDATCTSDAMCDDGNDCTMDSCHKPSGKCIAANVPSGTSCASSNKCLTEATCNGSGQCQGKPLECATASLGACETAACNPKTGACDTVPKADDVSCSDGNPCSKSGTCKAGKCAAEKKFDGTLCDSPEACRVAGSCQAGTCTGGKILADGSKCADGDPCTELSTCKSGQCQAGPGACDDNSPCTLDVCTPGKGCSHTATSAGAACNDNSPCTTGDHCSGKACVGTSASGPCDDGNACTKDDSCSFGECDGSTSTNCNDGNDCTADLCLAQTGECVHSAMTGSSCSDGNPCTTDLCNAGACKGSNSPDGTTCSDNNVCTKSDVCSAGKCAGVPGNDGSACIDATPCTSDDTCSGGKCVGTPSDAACNDGNPCTVDACDAKPAVGLPTCTHKPVAQGGACDDGDTCTVGDICSAGTCKGAVSNTCTVIFSDTFECGKNGGWVFTPAADEPKGVPGWAIDATASDPGYYSPACSLNFNNGKNFEAPSSASSTTVKGSAVSIAIDIPADATNVQLHLMSWVDSETSSTYDQRYVEFSTDGFAKVDASKKLDNASAGQKVWTKVFLNMDAYVGKKVQVRFRFDSGDGISNGGAGWFVDDVQVRWQK